uniref:Short-chain dehydrogenase/reductase 3 n=1 Tax=Parastrongyloides trichosuri TaxID=131310 RepID=A0A0N4ZSJ3_PARTI
MAKQFGKLGAKIIIWDINKEGCINTLNVLKNYNVECWYYIVDISKREEIYEAARKVKKDIGDVDILINNAGIVTGKKIFDSQDELMELTMAVNTISHFFTTKAFLPSMLERNSGHIVSIASLAGKFGVAGLADYCASKFGAIGFSESVAEEIISLKKDNVHVTTVCPYYIDTKMFEGVKTLSPNLLPILEPEYVVEKIIDAVLTNQEYLYMPKFSYFANILYAIFPVKATRVLAEYFGVNASIEDFIRKDDTN